MAFNRMRGATKFLPESLLFCENLHFPNVLSWMHGQGVVRQHALLRRVLRRGFSDSKRILQKVLRRVLRMCLLLFSGERVLRKRGFQKVLRTPCWRVQCLRRAPYCFPGKGENQQKSAKSCVWAGFRIFSHEDGFSKTGEIKVSTSTVAALFSKMALTGQRTAMVDTVFLVFTAFSYLP